MRCKYASGSGFNKPSSVSNYEILVLAKAIKNRCIKVVIELRVEQFWSEIMLVISNRTRAARSFSFEITRMISDQIALHSVQSPL